MINYQVFNALKKRYTASSMPFLQELNNECAKHKPYAGKRILQNIPLTLEAILKTESLVLGGAEVTVISLSTLRPNTEAMVLFKEANIPVLLDHNITNRYDFHLDCCAELLNKKPKYGAVELTQTGSEKYKTNATKYPVLSVDDSKLKILETLLGTGEGFTRALFGLIGEYFNKKFIIFGYGKVGRGIVHALLNYTDQITIIEPDKISRDLATKKGIKALSTDNLSMIKQELKSAFCIVTATGIKNIMSDSYHFTKADFQDAILTNMGAEDEYGNNFSKEDVLFDKQPLNFSFHEATNLKYLDPIFYAHNKGIDLLLKNQFNNGYNKYPDIEANNILEKWANLHSESTEFLNDYQL